MATTILAGVFVLIVDRALVVLNARKIILPQFDVTLVPYHDPRFTKNNY